ncbi:PD-(D/E)XK nuclease family protein [Aerophototrophica crusticola]|uniref:PD-(D/E)XK nuclease family protein n=1 Tax=Aerophototrophica crusticola TaxID=1709002 RepID=UPI00384F276F
MRQAFGLPAPERQVGQTAHDFAQAAGAPLVVLTRSERVEGTPTVPSRWLLRLDTVLDKARRLPALTAEAGEWLALQRALDWPEAVRPCPAPAPTPPVSARPRRLSVTQVEAWMRDPYAVYARHVLGLSALDPIDADPGAAERGQVLHAALDAFVRKFPEKMPPNARQELLACGRDAFGPLLDQPGVYAFWWPRFEKVADWFLALEEQRRAAKVMPLATEVKGQLVIDGPAGPFTLTAKADRLDRLPDGRLSILDYKTGTPPAPRRCGWARRRSCRWKP